MIIAGFGFRRKATLESLLDAYHLAGAPRVDAIATAEDKSYTILFQRFAQHLKVPPLGLVDIELEAAETLTQSSICHANRNIGSLAEASALGSIGLGAKLQSPRFISKDKMATCAIAQG